MRTDEEEQAAILEEIEKEQHEIERFPAKALALAARAKSDGWELKFHVFADGTNDFIEDPQEALALYRKLRDEGYPNVRLWYELTCPCHGDDASHAGWHDSDGMVEENHQIGYGGYPA